MDSVERVPSYIGGNNFLEQIRYMEMNDRERLICRIKWLLITRRSRMLIEAIEEEERG